MIKYFLSLLVVFALLEARIVDGQPQDDGEEAPAAAAQQAQIVHEEQEVEEVPVVDVISQINDLSTQLKDLRLEKSQAEAKALQAELQTLTNAAELGAPAENIQIRLTPLSATINELAERDSQMYEKLFSDEGMSAALAKLSTHANDAFNSHVGNFADDAGLIGQTKLRDRHVGHLLQEVIGQVHKRVGGTGLHQSKVRDAVKPWLHGLLARIKGDEGLQLYIRSLQYPQGDEAWQHINLDQPLVMFKDPFAPWLKEQAGYTNLPQIGNNLLADFSRFIRQ